MARLTVAALKQERFGTRSSRSALHVAVGTRPRGGCASRPAAAPSGKRRCARSPPEEASSWPPDRARTSSRRG